MENMKQIHLNIVKDLQKYICGEKTIDWKCAHGIQQFVHNFESGIDVQYVQFIDCFFHISENIKGSKYHFHSKYGN